MTNNDLFFVKYQSEYQISRIFTTSNLITGNILLIKHKSSDAADNSIILKRN